MKTIKAAQEHRVLHTKDPALDADGAHGLSRRSLDGRSDLGERSR